MKNKSFKLALLASATLLLASCNNNRPSNNNSGNGEPAPTVTIKYSDNKFNKGTDTLEQHQQAREQLINIGYDGWCAKAKDVGIAYSFHGDYTEAFAIQLNPTYFDCYLYNDGSVYGTYNADYVASQKHPQNNVTWGGDGHCDSEPFLGWWFNIDKSGNNCLIIQWETYGSYRDNHWCEYTKECPAVWNAGAKWYDAGIALTHNGNSRTCMIVGRPWSPIKNVEIDTSTYANYKGVIGKTINGFEEIQNDTLKVKITRENGVNEEMGNYLFDYNFDKDGNVTIEYPILGIKDTTSLKLTVTPTVYNTQIQKADSTFVDCTITRDASNEATLEVGGKNARFTYSRQYYRTVFHIDSYISGTMTKDEFDSYLTKDFYLGFVHRYTTTRTESDGSTTTNYVNELLYDYNCDNRYNEGVKYMQPAQHWYKAAEGTSAVQKLMGRSSDPEIARVHNEPNKGPGLWSENFEIITFRQLVNRLEGETETEPVEQLFGVARFFVTSNGEWVSNQALVNGFVPADEVVINKGANDPLDPPTPTKTVLQFAGSHNRATCQKFGNNLSGGLWGWYEVDDTTHIASVLRNCSAAPTPKDHFND